MDKKRVVTIGAGPAGMMAAIEAASCAAETFLVEKNKSPGMKLLLTGKGRCNLTNAAGLDDFVKRFSGRSGEFLRDAFKDFFNRELMDFFESRGLKLKVERQGRVFPSTDSSKSVLQVLEKELRARGVILMSGKEARDVIVEEKEVKGAVFKDGARLLCDSVIIATGGVSYRFTGSTGWGIEIAKNTGHRITGLKASLVPLDTHGELPRLLEGLALKNIKVKIASRKKKTVSGIGELLFTRTGVSGPLIISLSRDITGRFDGERDIYLHIDLKPALDEKRLHKRILRDLERSPSRKLKNIIGGLVPARMVEVFINLAGLDPGKLAAYLTSEERQKIVALLKDIPLKIKGPRAINEGMVTKGGVSLKDINPRTMESRIIKGLYFAGEVMDIDGDTGGFNLQAAFSTGYLAGKSAAVHPPGRRPGAYQT